MGQAESTESGSSSDDTIDFVGDSVGESIHTSPDDPVSAVSAGVSSFVESTTGRERTETENTVRYVATSALDYAGDAVGVPYAGTVVGLSSDLIESNHHLQTTVIESNTQAGMAVGQTESEARSDAILTNTLVNAFGAY